MYYFFVLIALFGNRTRDTAHDECFLFQMEASAEQLHNSIARIEAYQKHMRVRESQGRKQAELLNERVLAWSLICTFSILLVSLSQLAILKRFFNNVVVRDNHIYHRPEVIEFWRQVSEDDSLLHFIFYFILDKLVVDKLVMF